MQPDFLLLMPARLPKHLNSFMSINSNISMLRLSAVSQNSARRSWAGSLWSKLQQRFPWEALLMSPQNIAEGCHTAKNKSIPATNGCSHCTACLKSRQHHDSWRYFGRQSVRSSIGPFHSGLLLHSRLSPLTITKGKASACLTLSPLGLGETCRCRIRKCRLK